MRGQLVKPRRVSDVKQKRSKKKINANQIYDSETTLISIG